MSQSAVVHARIDSPTKIATEKVLAELGMTPTEAVRLLYRQIALRGEFPIELKVPNKLTASTLRKAEQGVEIESFETANELFETW